MRLSHAEAQALVSARLDGPLDPVAERELNSHLATCESCRAFNLSAVQLARGLQGLPRMPASPAVTRAVFAEVTAPRSGLSRLLTRLPENTLPVATAVAAAVIVLFVGVFGVLRVLDDDEPNVIPALVDPTADTNVAQQRMPTEEPAAGEMTVESAAPTDDVETASTETASRPTESVAGQPTVSTAATEPVDDGAGGSTVSADQTQDAAEEAGPPLTTAPEQTESPTEEGDDPANNLRLGENESPEATAQGSETVEPTATSTLWPTKEPQPTATSTLWPTREPEPTAEPTSEPAPTGEPAGETEVPTESTDGVAEIGPSGQSTARAETPEVTDQPTGEPTAITTPIDPTLEPTTTVEPTPETTATTEPTAEPTATVAPTVEPTAEPTATPEPTVAPEPTPEPTVAPTPAIVPRDQTPIVEEGDVTPEADDGTGAAVTEESVTDSQAIVPSDDEAGTGGEDASGEGNGEAGNGDQAQGGEDADGPPPVEPTDDDAIIGPPDGGEGNSEEQPSGGDEDIGEDESTGDGQPAVIDQATAELEEPPASGGDEGASAGTGSADVNLGTAPEVQDLGSVAGDPSDGDARLGIDADGQLVYARNPGRVSLSRNGITLQTQDGATGQVVGACNSNGNCVDISSASKGDTGGTDTPIGWIGDTVIYERLNGGDQPVEFRAITLDYSNVQPLEDRLIGGGPWDWETIVRPYPVNGGLLVPTPNYWLFITPDGVTPVSGNPGQGDLSLFRVKPDTGLIGYVSGGSVFVAPLDAPGEAIAQIPFAGYDFDISPDGSRIAMLSGDGISIFDFSGNLLATIPNPEGISVGSLAWLNEGLVFSDVTNGVLRTVQP
jgi:hypothetical protein